MKLKDEAISPTTSINQIEQLASTVSASAALNNRFFDTWSSRTLNLQQVCIFARNYGEFTREFPKMLCSLIANVPTEEARLEYVNTLYSEMGNGKIERVHSVLFGNMIESLTYRMGRRWSWRDLVVEYQPLDSTNAFLRSLSDLYSGSVATAVGAQLAQEWQAYTMLRKLYEGTRLYADFWADNRDAFHEDCEFYYAHLGEAEKEHKNEALRVAESVATSSELFDELATGFAAMVGSYELFWNGLADATEA